MKRLEPLPRGHRGGVRTSGFDCIGSRDVVRLGRNDPEITELRPSVCAVTRSTRRTTIVPGAFIFVRLGLARPAGSHLLGSQWADLAALYHAAQTQIASESSRLAFRRSAVCFAAFCGLSASSSPARKRCARIPPAHRSQAPKSLRALSPLQSQMHPRRSSTLQALQRHQSRSSVQVSSTSGRRVVARED